MIFIPKKICNYPNCKKIIAYKERYCEEHKAIKDKKRTEYFKQYDRDRREEKETKFYNTNEWNRVRKVALARDYGLCQRCMNKGITRLADMVHHIEPLKENWDKRLNIDNLQSLCDSCHKIIHKEIDKGRGGQ